MIFLGGQVSFGHLVHCVMGWIPLAYLQDRTLVVR